MAAVVFFAYDAIVAIGAFVSYVGIGNLIVYGYAIYSGIQAKRNASDARRAAAALASDIEQRMQMVRQAITVRRTIYGTVRVSGPITFFHSTNNNTVLHLLITLAGHEIDGIDEIYFNEERIDLDTNGVVSSGRWAGYVLIKKGLGSTGGDADLQAYMEANTGGLWTSNHKQSGCAKLYIKITFNRDLMAQGLPNVSCVVRGKKVYDPRSATTQWSPNTALCIRDYLTTDYGGGGVGATAAEVNDTAVIAAANVCDEPVDFAARLDDFSVAAVYPPAAPTVIANFIPPGTSMLSNIRRYAVTFYDASGETTVGAKSTPSPQPFRSVADANINDIPLGPPGTVGRKIYSYLSFGYAPDIIDEVALVATIADNTTTSYHQTDIGTVASPPSVSTFTPINILELAEGRYIATGDSVSLTTTGTLPAPLAPATTYYWIRHGVNLGKLATSFGNALAGTFISITDYGTGVHTVNADTEVRYQCNGTFDSSAAPQQVLMDLLSSMAGVMTYTGGKFTLYAGAWRVPTLTLTTSDLDGPVQVTSRVSRRDMFNGVKGVFSNPTDLWQPTDFPPVTNATYLAQDQGERIWSEIPLPFTTSYAAAQRLAKISLEKVRQQITVSLRCNLGALRAQAGEVVGFTYARFGWTDKPFEVVSFKILTRGNGDNQRIGVDLVLRETASAVYDWNNGEETILDPAPDTSLASPVSVTRPASLVLESGTDHLFLRKDGTVFSRIKASWDATTDAYVISGGAIEVQYQVFDATLWSSVTPLNGDESYTYILDVQDGQAYNVRVRFKNQLGIYSEWSYSFSHVVIGKTEPPATVMGFSAGQNGNVVVMRWTQVADLDLAGYEIRYIAQGSSDWGAAIPLTKVTRGTQVTSAALPPGSWTLLIAARDTSGNYSTSKTVYDIDVTNGLDIIYQLEQAPEWLGTRVNFVKHWTGVLVPDSQDAASLDTWDTFDVYVPNPYTTCSYEAPARDIGFVDTVRVWASAAAALGPGASGFPNPTLEIDYHSGAGYDGFESWTIGDVSGRYFKEKLLLDTSDGVAYVSSFKPTLDVAAHTESATDVVIGPTGTVITFNNRFHFTPNIQLTVSGGAGLTPSYTSQSATGFTAHVYDGATEVGGTINWTATGD